MRERNHKRRRRGVLYNKTILILRVRFLSLLHWQAQAAGQGQMNDEHAAQLHFSLIFSFTECRNIENAP